MGFGFGLDFGPVFGPKLGPNQNVRIRIFESEYSNQNIRIRISESECPNQNIRIRICESECPNRILIDFGTDLRRDGSTPGPAGTADGSARKVRVEATVGESERLF